MKRGKVLLQVRQVITVCSIVVLLTGLAQCLGAAEATAGRVKIPQLTGREVHKVLAAKFDHFHSLSRKSVGDYSRPALSLYSDLSNPPSFIRQDDLRRILLVRNRRISVADLTDFYRTLNLSTSKAKSLRDELMEGLGVDDSDPRAKVVTATAVRRLKRQFKFLLLRKKEAGLFESEGMYMICQVGESCPSTKEIVVFTGRSRNFYRGSSEASSRTMTDLMEFLSRKLTAREFVELAYKEVKRLQQ